MHSKPFLLFVLLLSLSFCKQPATGKSQSLHNSKSPLNENPYPSISKIPLPDGFTKIAADSNSFAAWLSNINLKKDKTVYKYNGEPKGNQSAQFAVLNISTGNKDLQQCADAAMRLRAEYLFKQKEFSQIVFKDNNGAVYQFDLPYNRENFMKYLERVFGMCGSASLSKQLKPVSNFSAIQPGDLIIRGGFPGHAVMVMEVAKNAKGKKIYLLAQGFMPAQDIHVLVNPANENLSPWYEVNDDNVIETPEYTFYKTELKKW